MARVLVVDDSSFIRLTIKKYFIEDGHTVVGEACDGFEAVEMYKELKPDIVSLDILMPKCDGIKALENILAHDSNAKVVIITDVGQQAVVIKTIQIGAKNFIIKPINRKIFTKIISTVLTSTAAPREKSADILSNERKLKKFMSFDTYLSNNPNSTYTLSMHDDSLKDAGYRRNDVMVIDSAIKPVESDIVLATFENQFVFGIYNIAEDGDIVLKHANEAYKREIKSKDLQIFGVVTGSVRKIQR